VRTTVRLEDDIYRAIKSLAETQGKTFGEVLSDLARRGLDRPPRLQYEDDLPVFEVREDTPLITPDLVRELRDDEP
jgi:hypothetical protein